MHAVGVPTGAMSSEGCLGMHVAWTLPVPSSLHEFGNSIANAWEMQTQR